MNKIIIDMENLNTKERETLLKLANKANKSCELADVKIGDTFKIAGVEFIKFADVDGVTTAVTKNILYKSKFGENNNFKESIVYEKLKNEFLPKIVDRIGNENIRSFTTDLTTLDGLKPYGEMTSQISLPTFDFYRANVEIFDKYKVDEWWWLSTPDTAKPHYEPKWVVCVSPSGIINYRDYVSNSGGVRPILNFVSSIFVSGEE